MVVVYPSLFFAWFVLPALMTVIALRQPRAARLSGLYALTVMLAHAVVALEAVCVLWVVQPYIAATTLARLGGAMLAGYWGYLGLDLGLYMAARMRMQWQLLRMVAGLRGFADELPWRAALAGCAALMALGARLGYGVSLAGWDGVAGWTVLPWTLGLAGLCCVLLGRWPARHALLWDNRVLRQQQLCALNLLRGGVALLHRAVRGARGAAIALPPGWGLPPGEMAEMLDTRYPLLRHTRGFRGRRVVAVRMPAGERPHVVTLFLESFRGADVGILGGAHGVTPHFDRLSAEGALWRQFYANGNTTSRAMVASFYGVPAPFAQTSTQSSKHPPTLVGMPQMFSGLGYRTAFFGDGPADWENKRDFYLSQGFKSFYSAHSIRLAYADAPRNGPWNFHDEYLMRFHADWLLQQDKRGTPTFSTMLTITNHMPWYTASHFPTPAADLPHGSDYFRFLRTMMYTDRCLGLYVDLLRERGLGKNVILVVLGDHGQQFSPQDHSMQFAGTYRDALLRVPLLVWAPGKVVPTVVDEVASQVDLLPTMMDMLGATGLQHGIGSSLLRANDKRVAITHHPMAPSFSSTRQGALRHTALFEQHASELYDVQADPREQQDLAAAMPDTTKRAFRDAEAMRACIDKLHAAKAFAPENLASPWRVDHPHVRDDFPRDRGACVTRLTTLQQAASVRRLNIHEDLERTMLAHVLGSNLASGEVLRLCQHIFHHTHRESMGEMPRKMQVAMELLEHASAGRGVDGL